MAPPGTPVRAYEWGVPPQDVLDRAADLREGSTHSSDLAPSKDTLVLVVGKARFTPDGYEIGDDGLVYLDAQDDGDGRVTLPSAQLPGVRTWQFDCDHGISLADERPSRPISTCWRPAPPTGSP